jgi:hypothetical protein
MKGFGMVNLNLHYPGIYVEGLTHDKSVSIVSLS